MPRMYGGKLSFFVGIHLVGQIGIGDSLALQRVLCRFQVGQHEVAAYLLKFVGSSRGIIEVLRQGKPGVKGLGMFTGLFFAERQPHCKTSAELGVTGEFSIVVGQIHS